MPAAYPRNVLRAIAATNQHAALSRLFGFVQLAFVELHRAGVFRLGAAGIEMDLGLGRGTDQQQGSDSDDFFHGDGFWLNDGAQGRPALSASGSQADTLFYCHASHLQTVRLGNSNAGGNFMQASAAC